MDSLTSIGFDGFLQLSDIDATRLFGSAFEQELSHLKNACVTVESTAAPALGRLGEHNNESPSMVLFEEDFAEVNRTLVSMLALKWVLGDDYSAFSATQNSSVKLTETSFQQLRNFFTHRVRTADDLYTLLVAIAIDDIGKDPQFAKEIEQQAGDSTDGNHSELVFKAAQADLIIALKMIPTSSQNDALTCLQIGTTLNISQVVQGECSPAALAVLSDSQNHGRGFTLRTMVTFLDVAGAAGHADSRSCVVMNEPVFQAYMTTVDALDDFVNGRLPSPRACYDHILETRANHLEQQGFIFPPSKDQRRGLTRLLCMGRVTRREQAEQFKQAFDQLSSSIKEDLVNGLSVDGIDDGTGIVPYYAPGLLAEAQKNTVDKRDVSVIPVLSSFMRFLSRVFGGTKPQPGTPGSMVERDLSFVRDTIKSRNFRDNPELLDEVVLPWKEPSK